MEDMDIQFYFLTANVLLIIVSKRKEHLSQHWTGCHDSDYWKLIYGTMAQQGASVVYTKGTKCQDIGKIFSQVLRLAQHISIISRIHGALTYVFEHHKIIELRKIYLPLVFLYMFSSCAIITSFSQKEAQQGELNRLPFTCNVPRFQGSAGQQRYSKHSININTEWSAGQNLMER